MGASKWAYTPEMCDGDICVGDCDLCDKPKIAQIHNTATTDTDYISRQEEREAKIYGNKHNCVLTIFGECSYDRTGCGSCEIVDKIREAISDENKTQMLQGRLHIKESRGFQAHSIIDKMPSFYGRNKPTPTEYEHSVRQYIDYLNRLPKKIAKKKAVDSLRRSGLIDENGKLKMPLTNGNFTIGT